jgi:Ni2+-binding GTPase involved in maturation of urease and hydrogenase
VKLHLVGGFLGSGKTTAIIQAARVLMQAGQRVGVITNDQGKYLVDTAFVRLADIPTVEVTGGCFCCNYADLDSSLETLIATARPDVIFAESVGSCADLVATVVKPLLSLGQPQTLAAPTSFSVFADGRLLLRHLRGEPLPFSDDVVYIYEKQLEEAGLVVVNKADLLSPAAQAEVLQRLGARWPGKNALSQSSLTAEGVAPWLGMLQAGQGLLPRVSLEIDYARYGHGEAQLAWLDEEAALPDAAAARAAITAALAALKARGAGVGHLKFLLHAGDFETKISFPTLDEPGWEAQIPDGLSGPARLLVNARVEMPAEELRALFAGVLGAAGAEETGVSYFHPKEPKPTWRMS